MEYLALIFSLVALFVAIFGHSDNTVEENIERIKSETRILKLIKFESDERLRMNEKIKEMEKKYDERRNEQNPCCHKCVLPLLLPRYERRRKKRHH